MKFVILLLVVAAVAVYADRPKSECEKHRERALKSDIVMTLIPKCKDNGDYDELQCYEDHSFCMCYSKEGKVISPPLSKLRECGCYVERQRKIDSNHENAFLPQCEADGKFAKKQCWDYNDSCWCVDEKGERQGKIVANGDDLDC